jgi:hypothetical protein
MTSNTDELVAIYQHIKANPDEWDQRTYASHTPCGTAFCVAGWAVARAGGLPVRWWSLEPGREQANHAVMPDGREVQIDDEALAILGLTDDQAGLLFFEENDLDDIRSAIFDITGVDPETAAS